MSWQVEITDQFSAWWEELSEQEQDLVTAAVERLEEKGPALGRPWADHIKSSRHKNMKELRPLATNIRIPFAFDPRRTAILLLGGDKTNDWQGWYKVNIPIADKLYDEHLEEIKKEGEI